MRGYGYKERRHLVSPRRVPVCPERGCVIDREEGRNYGGLSLFLPVSLAACLPVLLRGGLFMSLIGPPFQIKQRSACLSLRGDVGQSAAAGGNAGYFKLTPTRILCNFFLLLPLLRSHFLCLTLPQPNKPTWAIFKSECVRKVRKMDYFSWSFGTSNNKWLGEFFPQVDVKLVCRSSANSCKSVLCCFICSSFCGCIAKL